jgi:protein involved in sex pheromone biosynthesis
MKRVFFITAVTMTLLASCKDEPKTNMGPTMQEEIKNDNNVEMVRTQDSIQKARKKTMDSLEQIKSHGHAH